MTNAERNIEDEIEQLIGRKPTPHFNDVTPHYIPQPEVLEVPKASGPVDRFLNQFSKVQHDTSINCIRVAELLEDAAHDLRARAAQLNHQGTQIPDDLRNATSFEINARDRMQFFAALFERRD